MLDGAYLIGRLPFKCDGTRTETRFRLLAKRTSPFKSARASVQSTTGSRGVRISGSNAGYTMFRGSVKSTGYPLHSSVSPSLPLPCVTVCHHISTVVYKYQPLSPIFLLTYLLHAAQSFFRSQPFLSYSRNSPHLMEGKGSLPHSQMPATCPCPEQIDPVHTLTSHFLKIHLNIILPSTLGSFKCSLYLRFPHQQPCKHSTLSPYPYTPTVTPITRQQEKSLPFRSTSGVLNLFLCHGPLSESGATCGLLLKIMYRVIHKSLRDFRTRLRNNQDRHGRKEHINR